MMVVPRMFALPIVYWLTTMFSSVIPTDGEATSLLCLPSAVLLAYIVDCEWEDLWKILILSSLGALLAIFAGLPAPSTLVHWLVNFGQGAAALAFIRLTRTCSESQAAEFAKFVVAGPVLASLGGALLQAIASKFLTGAPAVEWPLVWLKEAVSMMAFSPIVLLVLRGNWQSDVRFREMDFVVMGVTMVAGIAVLVSASDRNGQGMLPPMTLLPLLLYLAARMGYALSAALVAVAGLVTSLGIERGLLLFGPLPPSVATVHAQVFLFVLASLSLSFALLMDRVRAHDEKLESMVAKRTKQLKMANAELTRLARTDPLTTLLNRRALIEVLGRECSRAVRKKQSVTLIAVDIDRFKSINDTYGHPFGDEVLRQVAETLRRILRVEDSAARVGGEEFVVVAPETNIASGCLLAERLRQAVASARITHEGVTATVTASFGVVLIEPGADPDAALQRADRALYSAKKHGRNRVELALAEQRLSEGVAQ